MPSQILPSNVLPPKASPPKGFIDSTNSATYWVPSVQKHKPMGNISPSNHHKSIVSIHKNFSLSLFPKKKKKEKNPNWTVVAQPLIPGLGRQKHEDLCEVKDSLMY